MSARARPSAGTRRAITTSASSSARSRSAARGVVLVEPLPEPLGQGEGRLHQRVPGPGPHRARVGRGAGEEPQRLGEDGLAGAGLPGDRGEPGGRRDLRPLDHHEVPHLERADHGRPNFSR